MNFAELLGPVENSIPKHFRKAILWGPEIMLVDSVEYFLKTKTNWEVVKISNDFGADYLVQQVNTIVPNVVILCQEKEFNDFSLLARLFQARFCLKVIAVSLENNVMQVYSKQNVMMHTVSDLLSVVGASNLSNHSA